MGAACNIAVDFSESICGMLLSVVCQIKLRYLNTFGKHSLENYYGNVSSLYMYMEINC